MQNCGCGWAAVAATKVDALFRRRNLRHFPLRYKYCIIIYFTWVANIIIPALTPYLTRPSESRLRPTWRYDENYFVLFGSLKVPSSLPQKYCTKNKQQSWFVNNTDNRYVDNPITPPPPDRNDPQTFAKKCPRRKWKHKRGRARLSMQRKGMSKRLCWQNVHQYSSKGKLEILNITYSLNFI